MRNIPLRTLDLESPALRFSKVTGHMGIALGQDPGKAAWWVSWHCGRDK